MRRRRRRTRPRVLVLLLLMAGLAGYGYWLTTPVASRGAAKVVTVEAGQSARGVAHLLRREGLIRSEAAFLALGYLNGRARQLRVGRYSLAPTMGAGEILEALSRGTHRAWGWVTVPEGYTVRQIAATLAREQVGGASDFAEFARSPEGMRPGFPVPETGLEGYLFPDTYRVEAEAQAEEVAAQMVRRFREVVWEGLFHAQPWYGRRSLNEVITLASLVEAEAKLDRERPLIAGVLMNRLERGQRLECDATVQYALGADRKARLRYKDLEIDSEYNTYRHAGLPPGPICSPGKASIEAALQPARVPYLYYVARPDGSHVFSTTFAQHTAAIARLRSRP